LIFHGFKEYFVHPIHRAGLLIAGLVAIAGCNDPTFRIDPILVVDTVEVAAPLPQNEALPTALDITGDGFGGVRGGRFPERAAHVGQWDFAVRVQGNDLVLVPARAIGLVEARSAITPALEGETFEGLRESPTFSAAMMETPVVMRVGGVYAARSREAPDQFGFPCVQYSKLQPLVVDVPAGRLRLLVQTNERCGDPRLVLVD
jgi:hypothetical protein